MRNDFAAENENSLIPGIKNLTRLSIAEMEFTTPLQPPSPAAFQQLAELNASHTPLGDEDLRRIVSGFKRLEELDMDACFGVTERGMMWLTRGECGLLLGQGKCLLIPLGGVGRIDEVEGCEVPDVEGGVVGGA